MHKRLDGELIITEVKRYLLLEIIQDGKKGSKSLVQKWTKPVRTVKGHLNSHLCHLKIIVTVQLICDK